MSIPLKVEFRIGEIEFKSEGDPADVEKQREAFVNTLLPLAVEAMVRTKGLVGDRQQYIEENSIQALPSVTTFDIENDQSTINSSFAVDFSRESLNSFINKFRTIPDQDFVILATYFQEKKSGDDMISITSDKVKQYYKDARRTQYSNISQLLIELVKKGLLKDDENAEKKNPKPYVLTNDGLKYAEEYKPKLNSEVKAKVSKPRKTITKIESVYSDLNADDLNLKKYRGINTSMEFKEQMILVMYIVACEGHGDEFSVSDVQFLLTNILGLPATVDQINGIFRRNKKWFMNIKDKSNKKNVKHKLLQGAKEFANTINENISSK